MSKYLTDSFLFFLFISQLADKKLMRNIGDNYDFAGRKVKSLLDQGILEECKINKPFNSSYIQLSKKGIQTFLSTYNLDKNIFDKMRSRIKGDENKYRQLKLGMTLQMLYKYFPEYCHEYLELETFLLKERTSIKDEIIRRKQRSEYGEFLITSKEMRDIDEYNLKKITSTRAQGIFEFNSNRFVIYNHDKKRMKCHGDFEEKFKDYFYLIFNEAPTGSINFGRSYKIPLDTLFKTTLKQRSQYIITKDIYDKNFFVPLNSSGVKQLMLYTIPDFRNKIRDELLLKEETERVKNVIYDGVDENDNIIYIGFECDITEIEKMQHILDTIKIASNLIVYCLPNQVDFYKKVFENRAIIKVLTVEEICEVLK